MDFLFTTQGSFLVATSVTLAAALLLFVTVKTVDAVQRLYHALHHDHAKLAHA